jgi:hypothetical protein
MYLLSLKTAFVPQTTHCLVGRQTNIVRHLKGRAAYYVLMSAVESPDDQKQGITSVYYNLDTKNTKSVNGKLRNSLPIHFASYHLCNNDETEFHLSCGAVKALYSKNRVRYRSHFGTCAEENGIVLLTHY